MQLTALIKSHPPFYTTHKLVVSCPRMGQAHQNNAVIAR